MQLSYFTYGKSKDDGISYDICYPIGIPKSVAIGTTSVYRFVPKCSHWVTLKYGCKCGCQSPSDDDTEANITKPFKVSGNEYTKIQAEHRCLIQPKNQFIKYLSNVKPLLAISYVWFSHRLSSYWLSRQLWSPDASDLFYACHIHEQPLEVTFSPLSLLNGIFLGSHQD